MLHVQPALHKPSSSYNTCTINSGQYFLYYVMSLCVFAAVFKPRVFSHFKLVRMLAEVGLTIELCMILLPVGQHFHVRRV